MKQYVLFDLDGTLTDPWRGLVGGYRAMEQGMGRVQESEHRYRGWVGPPIQKSLSEQWGYSDEEIATAVAHFRTYYSETGLYENDVYPGIPALLASLREHVTLCVATSKPEPYAVAILEHFGLAQHFSHIVGSCLDGTRTSKADVIAEVMRRVADEDAANYVMIGDREMDVIGAAAHKMEAIGVLWGYGSQEELENAGAVMCVESVEQLAEKLMA
ncbi:MAG: HAD hydrolase-like protein [Bacilli bacterium]